MPQTAQPPQSATWRVHLDRTMWVGGVRGLMLQALHPLAMLGVWQNSGFQDDPFGRLRRTADFVGRVTFGSPEEADAIGRRVRDIHRGLRIALPGGRVRRVDDPELLLWVLAGLADSALVVYERYVRELSATERDAYWQDYRVIGGLFGLAGDEMPADIDAFDAYMDGMLRSGDLTVTPEARELGVQIVLRPPVPLAARPLLELANQITVGLLPRTIGRQYGLRWDPARALALHGGAEYVKRVVVPLLPARVRIASSARATA